jgi:uncharacterized protein YcbK (DUF882 family)
MVDINTELSIKDIIKYKEARTIKLSKNFTLSEFLYSSTALRKNISNDLPREYLPRIQYLVDTIIQPIRDKFGPIKINSGYRSVELCLAIGSNSHSNHAYGFAADIEPYNRNISLYEVLEFIHNELDYKELIGEYFPTGWVHVAAEEDNNKRVLKLKDKTHNYSRVDLETLKESIKFA